MAKSEKFNFERFKKEAAERLKEGDDLLGIWRTDAAAQRVSGRKSGRY
ncbi:MAG: hypothetical protein R3D58_15340 [Saprospiraceae bacterium]